MLLCRLFRRNANCYSFKHVNNCLYIKGYTPGIDIINVDRKLKNIPDLHNCIRIRYLRLPFIPANFVLFDLTETGIERRWSKRQHTRGQHLSAKQVNKPNMRSKTMYFK